MYEQRPLNILVMTPINESKEKNATEAIYNTLYMPLVDKGYYVLSPKVSRELIRKDGLDNTEEFITGDIKAFDQKYGADAVLFTVIHDWEKSRYYDEIYVNVEYLLRSTKDNSLLYSQVADVNVDVDSHLTGSILLDFAISLIFPNITDDILTADKVNALALEDLPAGQYSRDFNRDQGYKVSPRRFHTSIDK